MTRTNRFIRVGLAALIVGCLAAPAALARPATDGPVVTEITSTHGGRYVGSTFVPYSSGQDKATPATQGGRYVGSTFVPYSSGQDKATPATQGAAHDNSDPWVAIGVAIGLAALLAAGGILLARKSRRRVTVA